MKNKIRGVFPPHNKNTAYGKVEKLPVPPEVHIPMKMHSGKPAIPVVKVGDEVKIGRLIGEMGGTVSSPIHSSVSGVVKRINERDPVTGQKAVSITIESDGMQTRCPELKPQIITCKEDFYNAIRDSGAVGLGGAGYPAWSKLSRVNLDELDYIIINGAECEPYVTTDTYTMYSDAKNVYRGVQLLLKYMQPKAKVYICIENNKRPAISVMQETFAGDDRVEIKVLPTLYPQGERKVLVANVTGRVVPEGARLSEVGVIVTNVTTIAVFARYIKTGLPLVYRTLTIDGPAVRNPKNVLAPIGTPLRALFKYCGLIGGEPKKIITGGPMMGIAQPSMDVPVVKTTNCVLAFPDSADIEPKVTVCIKCGRCLSVCPMSLMPPNIEVSYENGRLDALRHYKVNMCVECGSCAYICPAKRPLVQVMQLSKEKLWLDEQKEKGIS